MKTRFTLLFSVCSLWVSVAFAGSIGPADSLHLQIANAPDGGTVYVKGDELVNKLIEINKNITIKAADGLTARPKLEKVQFRLVGDYSFSIQGVEAFYDAADATEITSSKYFLQATQVLNCPSLEVINCEVYGYGRGFIRSDNANAATFGELLVENCSVHHISQQTASYSVLGVKTALISKALIKNTSFYQCMGGVWNSEITTLPIDLKFINVNFLNCSSAASKYIITTKENPGSSYLMENCIVEGTFDGDNTAKFVRFFNTISTDITTKVKNSIINCEFASSVLTEQDLVTAGVTIDYIARNIDTDPATLTGIGAAQFTLNGKPVFSGVENQHISRLEIRIAGDLLSSQGATSIEVCHLSGARILSGKGEELNLSALSSGVYLAKALSNNQVVSIVKFIRK